MKDAVLEQILQLILRLKKPLASSQRIEWKFSPDLNANGFDPGLDDSSWPVIQYVTGAGWCRARVKVPKDIAGIATAGSEVFFKSVMSLGGAVYVNAKLAEKDDFWFEPLIPLTGLVKAGSEILIAVKINEAFGRDQLIISAIDDALFEIDALEKELIFFSRLAEKNSKLNKALEKVIDSLNDAPDGTLEFIEFSKNSMKLLNPWSKEIKKYAVHLIGHAHIDMNWLWPWENTLDTANRTFETCDKLMSEIPGWFFSQSQAGLYDAVEKNHPQLFEKIKKLVKQGRWEIIASTWTEGDLNMVSGESLVRQTLFAKKYIAEKFNFEPKVCWCPDTFGHPWTYPQVLKKCGIDYYCFGRAGKGPVLFKWQGPDKSVVTALNIHYASDNFSVTPNLSNRLNDAFKKWGIKNLAHIFGLGDHGGGPTKQDIFRAVQLSKRPLYPAVKFSTAEKYFQLAKNEEMPVINDELNFAFEGCYTTHSDIKRMNREGEHLLNSAETWLSLANIQEPGYPQEEIKKAWQMLCFNQFHDILDGSGISETYKYSKEIHDSAMKPIFVHKKNAMKIIAEKVNANGQGYNVVVFNNLSWPRTDIVRVPLSELKDFKNKKVIAKNASGHISVCQFDNDSLVFEAEVPALGYNCYVLSEAGPGKEEIIKTENIVLENEFLRVKIAPALKPAAGCLIEIFDKVSNKQLLSNIDMIREANRLEVCWEKPHGMTAWIIGQIQRIDSLYEADSVEIISSGPVKSAVRVSRTYRNSKIIQDIILYSHSRRIEFETYLDWQEKGSAKDGVPMLRTVFPFNFSSDHAAYEIPFGYIERPVKNSEVPALQWAVFGNKSYSVGLFNDCKHGYQATGNTIQLTLLRNAYDPDRESDTGEHRFRYALYPCEGNWKNSGLDLQAWEFNYPLEAVVVNSQHGKLPPELSYVSLSPKNLILTALKKAEDGHDLILRFYEAHGKSTTACLKFGFEVKSAVETDLLEKNIKKLKLTSPKELKIMINKFEIKTIRIKAGIIIWRMK